jgi:large subunit ribosomal protein L17
MTAFIEKDLIKTTYSKAKAIQGDLDKLALLSLKKDLSSVKRIVRRLGNNKKAASLLVKKSESFLKGRTSGFTRIVKLPRRFGDNALMARIEWVDKMTAEVAKKVSGSKRVDEKKAKSEKSETKATLKDKLNLLTKKVKQPVKKD